jgi:hypothetical protein
MCNVRAKSSTGYKEWDYKNLVERMYEALQRDFLYRAYYSE